MSMLLILCLCVQLIALPVSAADVAGDPMWEAFETPAADGKSRPLFFWNEEVATMTPEKIRELMTRSYEESGYSGFGILPNWLSAYMSDDYMAMYRVALETAKEYGMKMCLYDENCFPSGSAGGILAKTYPEATAKRLDKQEWTVTGPQTFTTPVRADGKVCPCMALLHNGYTWMNDVRRKITHCAFGNIREMGIGEIWNSDSYRTFRRKFDDFDFASCLYCGHCELFAENKEDCIGNTHPACGGCLWAEGVLSCP